jgi:hypothetical protein
MGKRRDRVDSNKEPMIPITYQRYNYAPLENAESHIRLLRLRPSYDPSWPLHCTLFHTDLQDAPPYVALSYTWGDRSGSSLVLIGSDHVSITPNLKHALQRLRRTDQEVVIWVDALCINQDDVIERSIQTTRMRSVYLRAESVAVWLGMKYGLSHGAIDLVRALNACTNLDGLRSIVQDPERRDQLEALVRLFRRQYWWRIWVIQEVACAKRAVVYVGEDEISWIELDGVCEGFRSIESELHSVFYTSPSYVRTLAHGGPRGLQLSRYNPTIQAPPLLELLLTHKSKKSTDPKDKVFALVGISSSRHSFGQIDYSCSMREIYTHTVKHIVAISKKLDVVCVKQHDAPQFDLPSWAPDWTRPKSGAGATIVGLHHRIPPFSAAGESDAQVEFYDEGEEGDFVLRTRCVLIDTIESVGKYYKKRGAPSNVMPALETFHDWWSLFLSSGSGSVSRQDQTRFGRLISCSTWDLPSPENCIEKVEAIFGLSDEKMLDFDILRLDPPSRASTMSSSISSLKDQQEEDEELLGGEDEKGRLSAMILAGQMMNRRRMFVTQSGIVGLAPWNSMVGDEVVVLFGCKFPVVIRPGTVAGDGRRVRDSLVGEAYVEGFMEGEAIKGLEEGRLSIKDIELC